MQSVVSFRHMKPSDPIREYVEEKVSKIGKLLDRRAEAQIVLSVEKHLHVAHIELVTDGSLRMRGVEKSADMYGSIDEAVEKILRQVKRYREKIKNHREPHATQTGRELPHSVLQMPASEIEAQETG